ncbi:MAG: glycosyltransferase family 2 protein [Bacteroidota bacterium]
MAGDPLTYIIIVNWNGKQDTLECLASLRAATHPNARILVVDNGSQDGSPEAIRSAHPGVEILETGRNLRFAGGNNLGLRRALARGAEQVMLLNNDTTVAPDFLDLMTRCLRSSTAIGVVAPTILYYDRPDLIWYGGGEISFWTGTMRHVGIRQREDATDTTVRDTAYASGCCLLARREAVEAAGMLDETFFIYTEDADWCMRVRRAGFRIVYEPRARIWHKVSVSAGGHLSAFKLRHKFLSNMRFFARHAAWYHWFTFPWLNVVVNGVAAVRYMISRH